MEIIKGTDIENALSVEYRQYLSGHLSKPQALLNYIDADIEIGMSKYDDFTADVPHVHPVCTEYGYVLEGQLKVRILDGSGKEYVLSSGDFFVVRPGIPHASKNAPNTKVFFVKSPGVNDKTVCSVDAETEKWLSKWEI